MKKKLRKNLFTNESLFNTIVNVLKEKNLFPDILEYDLSDRNVVEIRTCEWDCTADLRFGGNEGIYLDVYAEGNIGNGYEKVRFGTFKTLYRDRESFYTMAKLQADFICEVDEFVNDNMEDFNWTGYDVEFYRENKKIMHIWTSNRESAYRALQRRYKYDFDHAIIIDNETNGETRVERSEITFDE